jgi:hypothetical protein
MTSGTFFNKMAIFHTFSRLYQRNHRIPNLFKALEFFFRIPKLFQVFPDRGNPVQLANFEGRYIVGVTIKTENGMSGCRVPKCITY